MSGKDEKIMKNRLSNIIKTITLSVVALAIIAVGTLSTTVDTSAAVVKTEDSGVIYVQYENMDYNEYWNKKAPEYTGVDSNGVGYLFGGWYAKDGDTYTAIENKDDLSTATVVAKFVPAQTLSVKCQNWAGTTADTTDGVIVRIVSAVDNKNYSGYGFEVSRIVDGVETKLGTHTSEDSNEVYTKFNYYTDAADETPDVYEPADLFGSAAGYFTSCTVGYIPQSAHGTIICIKPFWVTLDGVTVNGLSKFAHVEDGYLGYVNVPVNLNMLTESNGAAAGVLSVKAPANSGLTFVGVEEGVEFGKVFDEMEFDVLSDGRIKCVGNTSDISNKTEMDVYINLKFQKEQTNDAPAKGEFYTFTVDDEDFAKRDEADLEYQDVWNVIY